VDARKSGLTFVSLGLVVVFTGVTTIWALPMVSLVVLSLMYPEMVTFWALSNPVVMMKNKKEMMRCIGFTKVLV
jgi:hypothetical protein